MSEQARADYSDAGGAWQLIETAPKNGHAIWLAQVGHMRIGLWLDGRWADYCKSEGFHGRKDLLFTPTHWQPLPSPPKAEGRS